MARVFMTGGTGFISTYVATMLAGNGHEVHLFHRGQTPAALPDSVRHHPGDRTVPGELSATMDIIHPDVFLDMNAFTHEEAARAASAASQADVEHVVVISSGDVYRQCDGLRGRWDGPADTIPLDEDAPLRETRFPYREKAREDQRRLYDYDKIHVEEAYLEAGVPVTVLRLPKVFGPGNTSCFSDFLGTMERRLPVLTLSTRRAAWRWSRAEVSDVAAAIVETVEKPHEGIFNLGPEQCPTELDWIHMLGDVVGWAGSVREPRADHDERFDWSYHVVLDGSRFRETWDTRLLTRPQADLERALGQPTAGVQVPARSAPVRRSGLR